MRPRVSVTSVPKKSKTFRAQHPPDPVLGAAGQSRRVF